MSKKNFEKIRDEYAKKITGKRKCKLKMKKSFRQTY